MSPPILARIKRVKTRKPGRIRQSQLILCLNIKTETQKGREISHIHTVIWWKRRLELGPPNSDSQLSALVLSLGQLVLLREGFRNLRPASLLYTHPQRLEPEAI